MRALVLNGATGDDPLLDGLEQVLADALAARDIAADRRRLRDVPVAYCQGCFECWTRTPGVCKIDDAGRTLAEAYVASDLVVFVTRSPWGGYSSEVKKALDRMLGVILPFFRRIDGEVHHWPRYDAMPALGVLAVLDQPDTDAEATLRTLVERNAVNVAAPVHAVAVVDRPLDAAHQWATCDGLIAGLLTVRAAREPIRDVEAELPHLPLAPDGDPPTRALLLVGSAKPHGTSTSESLGAALLDGLAAHGVPASTRYVQRDAHSPEGLARLVAEVRAHDLLVLASPVYFDAYPSLVTRAMEAIAADRGARAEPPPLTVAALLNCGFPEAHHAAVARNIAALFARQVGARPPGALQLGGGGALHGRPLREAGHMVAHVRAAIAQAAEALARGRAIPPEARDAVARPLMPLLLYMAAGDAGWLWTAAHERTLTKLWAKPYRARTPS